MHIATEAIDRIATTAEAHERLGVVEVMGRNQGWIAVHAGIAGGADAVLIPEEVQTRSSADADFETGRIECQFDEEARQGLTPVEEMARFTWAPPYRISRD